MATSELSTGKTIFVLTVVAGCFAVLWPKIFYPMFFGSPQYLNNLEKAQGIPLPNADSSGCCDVIFEKDIQTLKILTQLCEESVLGVNPNQHLSQSALLTLCYRQLQETCNIDLSQVFKMNARHEFDSSFKEFLNVVRSYNSSLCLKDHYHVNWNLIGTPRIIKSAVMKPTSLINMKNDRAVMQPQMRQERPPLLRPEMLHPALRENGRVIPHEHIVPRVERDSSPRPVVKAGVPKPGMAGRPSFGGAGPHQGAKQGGGIMTLLMPMYTISIVAFFIYTMLRIWDPVVLFVKLVLQFVSSSSNNARQNSVSSREYYTESTAEFRSSYYEEPMPYSVASSGKRQIEDGKTADKGGKLVVSAISGLLEQVNREILESTPEIGPGPLSDPSQDGVQADKTEEPTISPESNPTLSEVPQAPPAQVNSSMFPSRQSSVLEVEVCDYEDVKNVLEKQRQQGDKTKEDAKIKDQVIDQVEAEQTEADEKHIAKVEEEIEEKRNIDKREFEPKYEKSKNEKEEAPRKEVESIVEKKDVKSVEKDHVEKQDDAKIEKIVYLERDVTLKGDTESKIDLGEEETNVQVTPIKTPEELIKENIAKISEELNKTIIGESSEYEAERNGPKIDDRKVTHVINGHANESFHESEKTRSDDFGLDSEDVSDSSTLHEEKSEGSPNAGDLSRKSDGSEKPKGAEAKPMTLDDKPLDARAVQVVNMERTESLVGGQKYAPPLPDAPPTPYAPGVASRPLTPDVPPPVQPHRIVLDGLLPESSQILVTDELTESESVTTEDGESDSDSVILSSKVTLSLIPAGGDREEQVDGRSRGAKEGVNDETISNMTRPSSLLLRETNGGSSTHKRHTGTFDAAETDVEYESEDERDHNEAVDNQTKQKSVTRSSELISSNANVSSLRNREVSSDEGDEIEEDFDAKKAFDTESTQKSDGKRSPNKRNMSNATSISKEVSSDEEDLDEEFETNEGDEDLNEGIVQGSDEDMDEIEESGEEDGVEIEEYENDDGEEELDEEVEYEEEEGDENDEEEPEKVENKKQK